MKLYATALVIVLLGLQYRLWLGDDGARSLSRLRHSVAEQTAENRDLLQRNEQLKAEVKDLKEGLSALEERARNDLGMIGAAETFYQVADLNTSPTAPLAPAQPPAPGVSRISR
jgi:cell division protein FtsB